MDGIATAVPSATILVSTRVVGLELRGGVERGVRGGVRRVRLVECGAVAAAAVRSVWQRCQIYRGARDIWSRTSVHDAPRDVDELFDDLFDYTLQHIFTLARGGKF